MILSAESGDTPFRLDPALDGGHGGNDIWLGTANHFRNPSGSGSEGESKSQDKGLQFSSYIVRASVPLICAGSGEDSLLGARRPSPPPSVRH